MGLIGFPCSLSVLRVAFRGPSSAQPSHRGAPGRPLSPPGTAPMQVVATAGHTGHGKSALVRALTGMDPGEPGHALGRAWTDLPSGGRITFVDAPGDDQSVPAFLAAAGPAPAVLFAVAADEGWQPQAREHLAALDAFGVGHGVLAVTRSDRADPRLVLRQSRERLAG